MPERESRDGDSESGESQGVIRCKQARCALDATQQARRCGSCVDVLGITFAVENGLGLASFLHSAGFTARQALRAAGLAWFSPPARSLVSKEAVRVSVCG